MAQIRGAFPIATRYIAFFVAHSNDFHSNCTAKQTDNNQMHSSLIQMNSSSIK